jgi:amidophosphoribosyltransferase
MTTLRVLDEETDRFRDECGVVGLYGIEESANLAYLALYAQQHRGQESAGIVVADGEDVSRQVGVGRVADVFSEEHFSQLPGKVAIGHVRYATAGENAEHLRDAQPLLVRCQAGPISIAHNGNLVNAAELRSRLESEGSIFQTTSDTEVICHLMARAKGSLLDRLKSALSEIRGAYSLCIMGDGCLYGVRDKAGVRPLVLGSFSGGYVLASETCAFDLIGAKLMRSVEPGEILVIDEDGPSSHPFDSPDSSDPAQCIFEHVYFARPDSVVFGVPVHSARHAMGRVLARESPADCDVVIPVPDSGFYAALGYAQESQTAFDMGLVRNHYVGRTFIEPEQRIRNFGVRLKLNPAKAILQNKRVLVVDDSIVRGTTSRKIVDTIRSVGAREVHVRISAPPTTHPCYYGVDTPSRDELIASQRDIEGIREYIGADSLSYLTMEGLHLAMEEAKSSLGINLKDFGYCDACFSGNYPIKIGNHEARR